jgi:CubicO group peptidase (beta-lactamase class C family)
MLSPGAATLTLTGAIPIVIVTISGALTPSAPTVIVTGGTPILINVTPGVYVPSAPTMVITGTAPVVTITTTPGALSPTDAAAVDAIVAAEMAATKTPGVVVAIISPKGYYTKGFGVAGSGHTGALSPNDHFRIGSVTKTFTATGIFRLIDAGLLHLSDTLDMFITGVPSGNNITIQMMLMMRSGVFDYLADSTTRIQFALSPTTAITAAQILTIIKSNPSQFTPGTQYAYTDSNYVLLGLILAQLDPTQRTGPNILTQDMIIPLGLTQTSYPTDTGLPTPYSEGYGTGIFGGVVDATALDAELFGMSGALISTIGDLIKWGKELRDGTLISPTMQNLRMTTFNPVPYGGAGRPATFGYGLGFIQLGSWFGHDGSVPGFECCVMFEPITGSVIAVMGNFQTNGLEAFATIWYNIANYLYPGSALTPGFMQNRVLTPAPAALTITGGTPVITNGGTMFLTPAAAPAVVTTVAPSLYIGTVVSFDSFSYATNGFTTSLSWMHTATAGADVFVDVAVSDAITGVTYGGVPMALVLTVPAAFGGSLSRYRIIAVPGGAKAVVVTGKYGISACARSFMNIRNVDVGVTSSDPGQNALQVATVAAGQIALQVFGTQNSFGSGAYFINPAGGTNRINTNDGNRTGICASDSTVSTTFTATGEPSYYFGWKSILNVLS